MTTTPVRAAAGTAGERWASGSCAALGQSFTVEAPAGDPALVARLAAVVEPLTASASNAGDPVLPALRYVLAETATETGSAASRYRLHRDGHLVDQPGNADYAARLLAWDINQSAVAAARPHRTVLHAAAVAAGPDVVLLAAPMEHGKTTTTAGLLSSGWDYVTDEAVALDRATLAVGTFPKSLSLDTGSWPLFPAARPGYAEDGDGQWLVPSTAFGARVATSAETAPSATCSAAAGPLRPRLILLPRYVAGATTRASELHPADALYRLAQCCFGFPSGGATDLATIAHLVRTCPAFEIRIGTLGDAIRVVAELAGRCGVRVPARSTDPAARPDGWDARAEPRFGSPAHPSAGSATTQPTSDAAPSRRDVAPVHPGAVPVHPGDVTVHVLDGEAVALGPTGDLHHLDHTATLVWQRLDGSVPVGRVAETLAAELRADPDVVRWDVLRLVSELVGGGLLAV